MERCGVSRRLRCRLDYKGKDMYLLTNAQMRAADNYTITEKGVPSLLLMERAGLALADAAAEVAPDGKIVCLCGGGNNGGDGLVCARVLKGSGREVAVVCTAEDFSADCRVNMEKWTAAGGELLTDIPEKCVLVVDCLYGTGFHGALRGEDERLVSKAVLLRKQGVKILSADIPSGVHGDNGIVEGVAIFADKTLCFGELKTGVFLNDGIDHAGEVFRVDIGICLPNTEEYAVFVNKEGLAGCLPRRKRNSHKGTYGKAAIVAGGFEYTGAAYLAAAACLRSGAGYTALFVPSEILSAYYLRLPEVLLKSINDGGRYAFNVDKMRQLLTYDAVAYGMGMGESEDVAKGAAWLLSNYEGRLVLDADALNSLARYGKEGLIALFKSKKCDVILTPHGKEFSRLSGISVEEACKRSVTVVKEFSALLRANVLLKNAVSVLSDGERTAINVTGCSGQAKAGSGDVLSGLIAGLCAMGISTYNGGRLAAYLFGKAAELASESVGEYSLTATDIISYLGGAFLHLIED